MTVKSIMTTDPDTLKSSDNFSMIQKLLEKKPFHHVLISDEDKFTGVITDRDIVTKIGSLIESKSETLIKQLEALDASKLKSEDCILIDNETRIEAAAILLLEKNVSCLPVIDKDDVIEGIVTWKDILKYYIYK